MEQDVALAVGEEGTVTSYGFKVYVSTHGIFDPFETEEAGTAHLEGEVSAALARSGRSSLRRMPISEWSRSLP